MDWGGGGLAGAGWEGGVVGCGMRDGGVEGEDEFGGW